MSLAPACCDMSAVLSERLVNFRQVLSAPRTDLLAYGAEPSFVQFGPVVVKDEYVLLLAVVTDRDGSVRASDGLFESDGPPHLTVGQRPDGGGWTRQQQSAGRVVWDIAGAPTPCLLRGGSPSWSKEIVESPDVSAVARRIDERVLGVECRNPVQAEICFELEADGWSVRRFVLVGGHALHVYRQVQLAFEEQIWNSICLVRVSLLRFVSVGLRFLLMLLRAFGCACLARVLLLCFGPRLCFIDVPGQFADKRHAWLSWARSDDEDSFGAHITASYPRPVSVPSSPVASVPLLARILRCVRRRPVEPESQLVIFVTESDLRRLAGSGLSSDQEAALAFRRWYLAVPHTRRFGTLENPSVSVDVEGVEVHPV